MMSTKRWAGFGLMFFGASFMHALGCGSSSTGTGPTDGGTVSTTTGAGGSTGATTSTSSTTTVGTGGSTGTGTGTGGSGGSGGGVPPGSTKLGLGCKADADCGTGLLCIKSADNLSAQSPGGPGNGLCSLDCTGNMAACGPFGGICLSIDSTVDGTVTKAACFETCTVGPNPPAAPVAKCHSRQDVACEPVNAAETLFACVPLCVTDTDCGTRKCEASSGLCVDTPMLGKPVGGSCTASRMSNTECAGGLCLPIESVPDGGTTPGICTALCRLGTQEACNFRITPLDAGPPEGACVLPWDDTGYNTGDLGLCLQLCDSTNDCGYRASNWVCRTDIRLQGFGHSVCLVPPPG